LEKREDLTLTGTKGTMTNKQRVDALLNREKPDRVPIYPFGGGFSAVYNNSSIADLYTNPKVSLAAQRKAARDFDWVCVPEIAYAAFGGWEFGGEIKWPDGDFTQAPSVSRHVASTPEEVMDLRIPDVASAGIIPLQKKFFEVSSQESFDNEPWSIVIQLEGIFTCASNIVGIDQFSRWTLKKPAVVHRLVRLTTDFEIEMATYWKDIFGTDGVLLWGGDPVSSNQVISPKTFETFNLPYRKEVHEKVLAMGYKTIFMHICGEQNENLPFWTQIPMGDPGIVSFGHEVDLEKAAEYFPSDIVVGNLEPAVIQTATPEEVYAASRAVIEKGKKLPCGFMFAPGCELPPMAPVENVKAMTTAVNDFGWF
jgi:uroporphyrinogen decarboxylase